MSKKNENSLHALAVRLCEGGVVWFQNHQIRAIECPGADNPCMICDMDSECRMAMTDLCGECESYSRRRYCLKIVEHPRINSLTPKKQRI